MRDKNKNGVFDNGETKIAGQSAIPYGTYKITMNVQSPKYSNYAKYPYARKYQGYFPRLVDVPHFDGILIHPGNTDKDSSGCILVGKNKAVGKVLESQSVWSSLMEYYFWPAKNRKNQLQLKSYEKSVIFLIGLILGCIASQLLRLYIGQNRSSPELQVKTDTIHDTVFIQSLLYMTA